MDKGTLSKHQEEQATLDKWEWSEEKKNNKRKTLYSWFLENEFNTIQEEFLKKGIAIASTEDISTYQGWKNKGRKVKRGSKGIKVFSKEKIATTIFQNGAPLFDEKTNKPMVRKIIKWYNFFHIDQTERGIK